MSLKEKYENYQNQKAKYEKEKYLYDSKESELRLKVTESLKAVNTEALTALGFNFTIDEEQLNNADYMIQKIEELKHIRTQLEEKGKYILRNY